MMFEMKGPKFFQELGSHLPKFYRVRRLTALSILTLHAACLQVVAYESVIVFLVYAGTAIAGYVDFGSSTEGERSHVTHAELNLLHAFARQHSEQLRREGLFGAVGASRLRCQRHPHLSIRSAVLCCALLTKCLPIRLLRSVQFDDEDDRHAHGAEAGRWRSASARPHAAGRRASAHAQTRRPHRRRRERLSCLVFD